MANEAVKRYSASSAGDVVADYTVADSIGIEKGTFLMLADPRTASGSFTVGSPCAGIAAREKVANDGRTQLAVHRQGDFDVKASGSITAGRPLAFGGASNYIMQADVSNFSGSAVIGYALQDATDEETFQMRLNL